jgi:hypothetical protein
MPFVRAVLVATTALVITTSGVIAQNDAHTSQPSSSITQIDDVSNWTIEKWNKAKAEWAREREKWDACQKRAEDKSLTGTRELVIHRDMHEELRGCPVLRALIQMD